MPRSSPLSEKELLSFAKTSVMGIILFLDLIQKITWHLLTQNG